MSVVRDFCGHGLGQLFHDEPNIVHVGRPGEGIVLRPGMFFTVEPMINLGRPHVKVLSDGWTAVTRDRSLSAQFEHTIGVTKTGVRDFHDLAQGPRQAAVSGLIAARAACDCKRRRIRRHPDAGQRACRGRVAMPARPQDGESDGRTAASPKRAPHYHGHRERLRDALPRGRRRCRHRLRIAGAGAVPRHPAARRQAARQGADRQVRLVRRGDLRAARSGCARSRASATPPSPS